jgi:hypothetical protein
MLRVAGVDGLDFLRSIVVLAGDLVGRALLGLGNGGFGLHGCCEKLGVRNFARFSQLLRLRILVGQRVC